MKRTALAMAFALVSASVSAAVDPATFQNLAFRQHPGAQLPLDARIGGRQAFGGGVRVPAGKAHPGQEQGSAQPAESASCTLRHARTFCCHHAGQFGRRGAFKEGSKGVGRFSLLPKGLTQVACSPAWRLIW